MSLNLAVNVVQYIMSVLVLVQLWWIGDKNVRAWWIGIPIQIIYLTYFSVTHQWGLLPGTIGYTIITIRNFIEWRRDLK